MASYKARKLNSCPLGRSPAVSRTAKIINNSLFLSHGFTTWPRRAKSVLYRDSRACPENFITVSTSQAILRILKIHTTYFREFLAIISFSARGIRKESFSETLVCYTAVFSVVTHQSSPLVGRSVAWRHWKRLSNKLVKPLTLEIVTFSRTFSRLEVETCRVPNSSKTRK